ncbi:MAG: hypothetical protein ACYS9X_10410 [Planctomycetota bacterium]
MRSPRVLVLFSKGKVPGYYTGPESDFKELTFRGRIWTRRGGHSPVWAKVDTAASRFTGASIAGLVVGAMGCFIFGLYLRARLRERKAFASQPGQDMIA